MTSDSGQTKSRHLTVWSWCMYDWANSGYTTLLITVFVVFIQRVVFDESPIVGATVWAWSIALSMLVGALLSPIVGAIADEYSSKRIGLALSAIGGGLCCVSMGIWPSLHPWAIAGLLVLANIGLELSLTFYNGFLPEIVDESELNRVSSLGFSVGYFGGGLALLLAMIALNYSVMSLEATLRACIVGTGLWWIVFTIPTLVVLRDQDQQNQLNKRPSSSIGLWRKSWADSYSTLRQIMSIPTLFWFLIAFLIYNDGVQTVISQSSTFALLELEFSEQNLVAVVLMIQFVATPGALMLGWFADKSGRENALTVCLLTWIALLIVAWFVDAKWQFWILAAGVAIVLGGIQSVSRAVMGSLTPQGKEARYFGFFNLSGKATSFLGTFFFGAVVAATGSSRIAIVGLAIFFIIGLLIISRLSLDNRDPHGGTQRPQMPDDRRGPSH